MLLLLAFVLGALFGWQRAARRGGDRLDRLQYAAVHGIIFVLVALVALVLAQFLGLA
jgi:phosphate/sulfate permease